MAKLPTYDGEVNNAFEYLLEEYCAENDDITESIEQIKTLDNDANLGFNLKEEETIVTSFLKKPCPCLRNCQELLNQDEVISNRAFFRSLGKKARNHILLVQLKSLLSPSEYSMSARTKKHRERKRFDYHISIDRPVCKDVFPFYYGETSKRLDRLKSYVSGQAIDMPVHGNAGRTPTNAYSMTDREKAKIFVLNFTAINGLPDPGRDVRKGKGKLRILLPSIMNFNSVHRQYAISINLSGNTAPIAYRTFLNIWQDEFPHVKFNDPRSDLCMTCEDFKKRLNQVAAALDENKEKNNCKYTRKHLTI